MKIHNSSNEKMEDFKYMGKTSTNQNSIQAEIKSRLKLGNAWYYSIQNLLSSRLLSKKLNYMSSSVTLAGVRDLQYRNHIMNSGL
jgi:hypothetical protein